MFDADVRDEERSYRDSSPADRIRYAREVCRLDRRDEGARSLSALIADDGVGADIHLVAIEAFLESVGPLWIDASSPDQWTVSYFAHGNRFIIDELDKDFLDEGARHTQARHIALARDKGRQLQGLHEYVDFADGLYKSRDNSVIASRVEAVRTALQVGVRRSQLLASGVDWTRRGEPDVFYNSGRGQGVELALAGPCGYLRDLSDMVFKSSVVFGTEDVGAVAGALGWIGQSDKTRVWRHEEQDKLSSGTLERVVGLHIVGNGDGVCIVLYVNFDYDGVARGWSRRCVRNFSGRNPSVGQ